jgi:hypothetical protein
VACAVPVQPRQALAGFPVTAEIGLEAVEIPVRMAAAGAVADPVGGIEIVVTVALEEVRFATELLVPVARIRERFDRVRPGI